MRLSPGLTLDEGGFELFRGDQLGLASSRNSSGIFTAARAFRMVSK